MTDMGSPTYHLDSDLAQRAGEGGSTLTPERRLKRALANIYHSIDSIVTMRREAVRSELNRHPIGSFLGRLLSGFTNPFLSSDQLTTEDREQQVTRIRERFKQAEGRIGGKLLRRQASTPTPQPEDLLYIDDNGEVVWIREGSDKQVVVTRYQFGSENEPEIVKSQSRQAPGREPSKVDRTLMRLDEASNLGTYLPALRDQVAVELYGSPDSGTSRGVTSLADRRDEASNSDNENSIYTLAA